MHPVRGCDEDWRYFPSTSNLTGINGRGMKFRPRNTPPPPLSLSHTHTHTHTHTHYPLSSSPPLHHPPPFLHCLPLPCKSHTHRHQVSIQLHTGNHHARQCDPVLLISLFECECEHSVWEENAEKAKTGVEERGKLRNKRGRHFSVTRSPVGFILTQGDARLPDQGRKRPFLFPLH